jgi:3-oxo-5-alpha-steroid 4-dehydrogenase 3
MTRSSLLRYCSLVTVLHFSNFSPFFFFSLTFKTCGLTMAAIGREECLVALYLALSLITWISPMIGILRSMSSHGKSRHKESATIPVNNNSLLRLINQLEVPKHWFLHFYIVGIASTLLVASYHSASLRFEIFLPLLLQVSRRCYECLYVHAWRSASRMHITGYALGMLHYSLLPFNFVGTNPDGSIMTWRILGILMCLYGQYEQDAHHRIMAKLRLESEDRQGYILPRGRWFDRIGSPQYLAEIIVYSGFFMMLQRKSAASLLLWVSSNQIIGALSSHEWYLQHFDDYKKQKRRAIIPNFL